MLPTLCGWLLAGRWSGPSSNCGTSTRVLQQKWEACARSNARCRCSVDCQRLRIDTAARQSGVSCRFVCVCVCVYVCVCVHVSAQTGRMKVCLDVDLANVLEYVAIRESHVCSLRHHMKCTACICVYVVLWIGCCVSDVLYLMVNQKGQLPLDFMSHD